MTDQQIAAQLQAEQAARKLAKARARVATMLAKKSGTTKRMPLMGRDAFALINSNKSWS
jgi:hypothetical protein